MINEAEPQIIIDGDGIQHAWYIKIGSGSYAVPFSPQSVTSLGHKGKNKS
jgi:hypothetical protein